MSMGDRFLRAAGIGFIGAFLVWVFGLAIVFIAEDAGHARAHLTVQKGQVAWLAFIIAASVAPMVFALFHAARHLDD